MDEDDTAAQHEVLAFRFASSPMREPWQNYLQPEATDLPQALDFYFFAIRTARGVVLVDTGFSTATGLRRGMRVQRSPLDSLGAAGIAPQEVTDVILTHLHWDHAGCLDMFPQATVHLQREELAFVTGPCMCEPLLRRPFDTDDVLSTVHALHGGRLRLHEGDARLGPGITLHHVGGHTKGLQVVRVSTRRGYLVLAGDAAHLWRNLHCRNPFPVLVDVEKVMQGFHMLESLACGPDSIIPGHDPRIAQCFPRMPGQEEVFQLHVAPIHPVVQD